MSCASAESLRTGMCTGTGTGGTVVPYESSVFRIVVAAASVVDLGIITQ